MCQYEDWPIISRYTRQQAVEDGVLVQILTWNGKPVMATTHLQDRFTWSDLFDIWLDFRSWKTDVEPGLPEEEKLFATVRKDQKVWVIEDAESFTLMYPEDY
jgi:hypothetical protein